MNSLKRNNNILFNELEKSAQGTYKLHNGAPTEFPRKIRITSIAPLIDLNQAQQHLILQLYYTDSSGNTGVLTHQELGEYYYRVPSSLKEFGELVGVAIRVILGRKESN